MASENKKNYTPLKSKIMSKIIVLIVSAFLIAGVEAYSQTISCQELYETVTKNNRPTSTVTCMGSTMLVKAEYYTYQRNGYVVAYIKKNQYDFRGTPYIFCGISSYRWSTFRANGMSGSWGKAFHEHIMDNKCDCY